MAPPPSVSDQVSKTSVVLDFLARTLLDFCPFCGERLDSGAAAFGHRRAHFCEHFEHYGPAPE